MENWDDELAKIMEKKLKQYKNQVEHDTTSDNYTNNVVNSPIKLTDYNFEEMSRKYQLLVVDFWAPWCGPCRMVSPIIDQLAQEMSGRVVFGKLNVDENPTLSNLFGIQSIPTVMIFKNGEAIDGFMGAVSKQQMVATISKYI